jgi:3-oxoadipate enol-lactonase
MRAGAIVLAAGWLTLAIEGLHVETIGRGPAVVLVHAFHMDLREWDEQLAALTGYLVVRYDVRGHGKSGAPGDGYAAHEDVRGVLTDLGIERASIVGHSMGGQIAVDFALSYPSSVDRLVLVSPGLSGFNAGAPGPWFKPIIDAVRAGEPKHAAELWWESPMMAGVKARGEAGERYHNVIADNAGIWTMSRGAEKSLDPPALGRLSELKARTLVVIGDRDEAPLKAVARRIVSEAPSARLVEMKATGHMAPVERPTEFNRLLVDFLKP